MRSLLALGRVETYEPDFMHARVDAEERQRADVRVGHDLERERRERRVVATRRASSLPVSGLMPVHRRHVERRRQVVDDRVEQRLHALVLEGASRTAPGRSSSRACPCGARRGSPPRRSPRRSRYFSISDSSTSATASSSFSRALGGRVAPCRRESRPRGSSAPRLSSSQIDRLHRRPGRSTPRKLLLGAERQLERRPGSRRRRSRICATTRSKSAPTRSILLTNAMRGTPYLSAWRHTVSDCGSTPPTRAEHRDRAVEDAQGALDLDREVDVARACR